MFVPANMYSTWFNYAFLIIRKLTMRRRDSNYNCTNLCVCECVCIHGTRVKLRDQIKR